MTLPAFVPDVCHTAAGTPYLREPGVALVAMPRFLPMEATNLVNSFGDVFDAADYENDWFEVRPGFGDDCPECGQEPKGYTKIDDGAALCKFAGQTCYLSFGEKRTRNNPDEVKRYFDNIKQSGHGSVVEHAYYSMVVWGVDRAFSHEMVRHRAGWAYSQLSQRYVSGKTLRFVERPEYQDSAELHKSFERWIDLASAQYDDRAAMLQAKTRATLEKMTPTERRKAVNQAARNCLPNETETAIVLTGNVRAWRHVLEMRASVHADLPIAKVMSRAFEILRHVSPVLFDDYEKTEHPDGREVLATPYRKV